MALALALLAGPATAAPKKINTEQEFRTLVVGRTFGNGDYSAVIKADGTMSGARKDGVKIVGNWAWNGKLWCRNIAMGKQQLGTDCGTWTIDGNKYRLVMGDGKGKPQDGTIK
ncbi:hypothetical protein ACRARG_01480 [Pseudooceanicola sp. C21-150M6]|uniref:hypothetical protein n=1 Tax=Pseudooceanicola sp. C21-150M6 TaxID=3434355 RepID=UPI003D7F86B0